MTKAIFRIFWNIKRHKQKHSIWNKQTLAENGKYSKFEVGKGGDFWYSGKKDSEVDEYAHAYKGFDKQRLQKVWRDTKILDFNHKKI